MTDLNLSVLINGSGPDFNPLQKKEITTETLRQLCGIMDSQAFNAAVIGFVLAILALFYFGRIKPWLQTKKDLPPLVIIVCDKLLLIGMALCFALIITRLLRAS